MKKLYILVFVLFISCSKDVVEPQSYGMLEEFFSQDSEIVVGLINRGNLDYINYATKRGFIFKPLVDIEITAIGGRMAKTGKYEIEIIEIDGEPWEWISETDSPILTNNVTITNTKEFQFTKLDSKLLLQANKRYVIRYFDENHESVYDVLLPDFYWNESHILHPQKIKNIELGMMYYAYYLESNGYYHFYNDGGIQSSRLFLRGIPDFKYQVKE